LPKDSPNRVLVASKTLTLLDLTSGEKIMSMRIHKSLLRAITFVEGTNRLVGSCAEGEKFVVLWSFDENVKKNTTPLTVLRMYEPALNVVAYATNCSVLTMAVSEKRKIYIWRTFSSKSSLVSHTLVRSNFNDHNCLYNERRLKSHDPVLAAKFEGAATVIVALGSHEAPIFARFELQSARLESPNVTAGTVKDTEDIRTTYHDKTKPYLNCTKEKISLASKQRALNRQLDLDTEKKLEQHYAYFCALEEKTATIEQVTNSQTSSYGDEVVLKKKPLQADSVVILVTEALRSKKSNLLERCFEINSDLVLQNTCRWLIPSDVIALLRALVVRVHSQPERAHKLLKWLRFVIVHHFEKVMSSPDARSLLVTLGQTAESHLSMYRPLVALAGRLDLLTHCRK